MSNPTLNCLQSLWNLSFLKSGDLRKTSLNQSSSPKRSFKLQINQIPYDVDSPKVQSSYRKKTSYQDIKRELDTPSRGEKEKKSITEKDFRIMQVLHSFVLLSHIRH